MNILDLKLKPIKPPRRNRRKKDVELSLKDVDSVLAIFNKEALAMREVNVAYTGFTCSEVSH